MVLVVIWQTSDYFRSTYVVSTISVFLYNFIYTLIDQWVCLMSNTLVQRNIIMYAYVTLPLTLVSNTRTYHFSPRYFNGIKIVTAFKCTFEETMSKLSVNFGNHISQDSHKNQYPCPVCNFGFTASHYSENCWSNLPLKCRIFLIGNTQRKYCITCAIIRFMFWLVCLEPATTCWYWSIIKWRHHCTSIWGSSAC